MQFKALLLDLDGTLVDTAPDMVGTLNRVLAAHNQPSVDPLEASKQVSNGARALLEFGFARQLEDTEAQSLIKEFLADYEEHISDLSRPYAGMTDVLDLCEKNQIRWGVVTNKPLTLSRKLLLELGLLDSCSILLGGDSLPLKKPNPAPLLHCCMTLNLAASECIYVGDHHRDIMAGNAAGMDTAAAQWGYIPDAQEVMQWDADFLLSTPQSLLALTQDKLTLSSH
jgi:phosphoglycolate phosphatase